MITVIVTSYNHEKYILQAVESLLKQTYKDFTVFFVDDGSTDDTVDLVIKSIDSMKKNKISAKLMETNDVGASNARHIAISACNTPYYVPLDGDDLLDPKFLEKTIDAFEKNPEYGFVYTDTVYFGEENMRFFQPEYSFFNLVFQNYICYASLFKTSSYFEAGGYNLENRNYYEDWELSIRLGKKGLYGYHISEPLFFYRTHAENSSKENAPMDKVYRSYFITKYKELYPQKMVEEAERIMKKYPDNFMSLKVKEQKKLYYE